MWVKILIITLIALLLLLLFMPIKYTLVLLYESKKIKATISVLGIKINLIKEKDKNKDKHKIELKEKSKKKHKFISPKDFAYIVKVLKKELPGIFNEVKPSSVKTKLNFGPMDLFKAGIAAAVLGPIKVLTGKDLGIKPSFKEKGLSGSVTVTGRPQLYVLILSGIRLFTNRRFMNIIK